MEILPVDDYAIIDVPNNASYETVRKAYIKKVKELHPDLARGRNPWEDHLRMIRLNQAYGRLKQHYTASSVPETWTRDLSTAMESQADGSKGLTPHKDPAYVYYKLGFDHFRKIHPSKWTSIHKGDLLYHHSFRKSKKEIVEEIRLLFAYFPKAYYFFSIVTHDYPESNWSFDARQKMLKIEDLTKRYVKIIASYEEHEQT